MCNCKYRAWGAKMILIDTQKKEFNRLKDIRILEKGADEVGLNGDILVIGLGGVGIETARSLKGMLANKMKPEDNIEFLVFDSDIPNMEQTIEDSREGVGFNATEVISIYRKTLDDLLIKSDTRAYAYSDLAKWMDPEMPELNIGINGTKGNRQIGRLMFSNAYEEVRVLLFNKINMMYEKSKRNGGDGKLDFLIISGAAGGTGGGIIIDLAYNIRAFCKAKKFENVRLGSVLMTPDVLFADKVFKEDQDLTDLLNANGLATLKEITYYMDLKQRDEMFCFESTTHKLTIKENVFDSCMLVSGRKDNQGYIPAGVIYSDAAYFMLKLVSKKFIGSGKTDGSKELLRDVFFRPNENGPFKIISETDYRIPIKEIENISEYEVFKEAYKLLNESAIDKPGIKDKIEEIVSEFREFINQPAGEQINLKASFLIDTSTYGKPLYKSIKKGIDTLQQDIDVDLNKLKNNILAVQRDIKLKFMSSIEELVNYSMVQYGPFATMKMIGAKGYLGIEEDTGLVKEIKTLEEKAQSYRPTGEFERIIQSIRDICAKRFFAFPSAKRETENGYYDACIKNALSKEKTILMDAINAEDVYGDTVRWLYRVVDRYNDIFGPFCSELYVSIDDLASNAKRTLGYMMKEARQSELLPVDYVTPERIEDMRRCLVKLFVENEANIENDRSVSVKEEMERIYKNLFAGLGAFAPEKFIFNAFSDEKSGLQELITMFVAQDNEKRDRCLYRAAKAFVQGTYEKVGRKKLCVTEKDIDKEYRSERYISLPDMMPHFSEEIKKNLIKEPYNISPDLITMNVGEVSISSDEIVFDVPYTVLGCADDMLYSYVQTDAYKGLHIDQVHDYESVS